MWIFTPIGFFSAVTLRDTDALVVRARALSDLEALRDHVLPDIEIHETPERDYRWRATVSRDDWEQAVAQLARAIDYPNFKSEVARRQGADRAHRYGEVWSVMYDLQHNS
jgi:hypothetical protein